MLGPTAGPPSLGGCRHRVPGVGLPAVTLQLWGPAPVSVCPQAVPPGCGAHGGCWSPRTVVGLRVGIPHGHILQWGAGGGPVREEEPHCGQTPWPGKLRESQEMEQPPQRWEEVDAQAGPPPLERRDPTPGLTPRPREAQSDEMLWGSSSHPGSPGQESPLGPAPRPAQGCRRGVPRSAARAPCPPRLLRIPQRLSRAGPPPARGAPPAGQGGGRAPRGGVGMEGPPRCHVCWVRRAPRHGPSAAPTLPWAMRVAAGAQPGDGIGSGSGAHWCTELPVLSCPPDVRRPSHEGGIVLCHSMPFRATPCGRQPLLGPGSSGVGRRGRGPGGGGSSAASGAGASGLGRPGHRRAGGRHRPPLPLGKASLGQARGD